ncbi:stage V sporulation protein AC [[Clostridium] colinum]|uniref:stage V sporulation protein AC n=1 Tax=[Clostridium] colinum TaxID=36835 RepID=UPI00202517CA|nr:stage V sporulation protein AC [[Clostridium] colinum]
MDNNKSKKQQQLEQEYQQRVKELSPNSKIGQNCFRAFIVGGTICCIGQFITNILDKYGLTRNETGMYTSMILIFIASLLTGLGIYQKIGHFAGAGSIVPITGFSNSVTSPALEFKKEGFILGLGAKIFILAGPVILYGTLTSVLVGLVYYFVK